MEDRKGALIILIKPGFLLSFINSGFDETITIFQYNHLICKKLIISGSKKQNRANNYSFKIKIILFTANAKSTKQQQKLHFRILKLSKHFILKLWFIII